jgi:hypothetical protein
MEFDNFEELKAKVGILLKRKRRQRIEDFMKRGKYSCLNDTKYITVHPFSDDIQLLVKIKWKPEYCNSVDAYWNIGKDILFVQIYSIHYSGYSKNKVERNINWSRESGYVDVVSIINENEITKEIFERELKYFLSIGVKTLFE